MKVEVITKRDDLLIRRMILEPGESMPWHTDLCHRFTVVIRGDSLGIEFRKTGEIKKYPVHAGMTDWDKPEPRVHRGVNLGSSTYEEAVTFYLDGPGIDPQPEE